MEKQKGNKLKKREKMINEKSEINKMKKVKNNMSHAIIYSDVQFFQRIPAVNF